MAGDIYDYTRFGLLSIASDGVSVSPPYAFSSETSLGFYRSANSTIAQSYGTFSPGAISTTSLRVTGVSSFVGIQSISTLFVSSAISLGTGGTPITGMSSISSLVAAFVVQGSASSFTIVTWPAVNPGDQILTTPFGGAAVSSISSGCVLHSHCTQAGQIEFRISNCSTLAANVSSKSYFFTRIAPF